MERGKKDPSLKSLIKIARALGMPMAALVASLDVPDEAVSKGDLLLLLGPIMKDYYRPEEVTTIMACVRNLPNN